MRYIFLATDENILFWTQIRIFVQLVYFIQSMNCEEFMFSDTGGLSGLVGNAKFGIAINLTQLISGTGRNPFNLFWLQISRKAIRGAESIES